MMKLKGNIADYDAIRVAFILALLYSILFNSSMVFHHYSLLKVKNFTTILVLSKDVILSLLVSFTLFFGLTLNRYALYLFTIILFLSGAAASYYLYLFKIQPTQAIVVKVLTTSPFKTVELMSLKLVSWMIFAGFTGWYGVYYYESNIKTFMFRIIAAFCLFISIYNIIEPQYQVINNYFPNNYLHNTYVYLIRK